jgi:nucleotide-binding universal stress UspA family protein
MGDTPTIRTILFATDFSEASAKAGQTAAQFARHFGARLHVLHVVPPATDPSRAPSDLAEAAANLGPGLTVTTEIGGGLVARQISACARRQSADLIVIGTHGRTGLTHVLLGSVAEGVVRRAPCRVLTVPARVRDEQEETAEEGRAPAATETTSG